jgi:WhiB family redox-sensing transcriptional regulator
MLEITIPLVSDIDPVFRAKARCADGSGTLTHLFYSEDLIDIARAKAICRSARRRRAAGASAPNPGAWRPLQNGHIVTNKRRRGRPPIPQTRMVVDEARGPTSTPSRPPNLSAALSKHAAREGRGRPKTRGLQLAAGDARTPPLADCLAIVTGAAAVCPEPQRFDPRRRLSGPPTRGGNPDWRRRRVRRRPNSPSRGSTHQGHLPTCGQTARAERGRQTARRVCRRCPPSSASTSNGKTE